MRKDGQESYREAVSFIIKMGRTTPEK